MSVHSNLKLPKVPWPTDTVPDLHWVQPRRCKSHFNPLTLSLAWSVHPFKEWNMLFMSVDAAVFPTLQVKLHVEDPTAESIEIFR